MPRPPSFDEANMYDKPQVVADRPRFTFEKEGAIEENWRQELESLMRGRRGGGHPDRTPSRAPASWTTR